MQFFSIYDLIISRSKERNMTTEDMFSFFSAQKISKATLICLQQTSFLPDKPAFKNAIIDFLGMNELEIELAMGHIPAEYSCAFTKG